MNSVEEPQTSQEPLDTGPHGHRKLFVAMTLVVLLVLAIALPPLIHLGRYRHSITASIAEALGRPVYAGGMTLRLLPTPGIVMSDFTVEEDPAFGYEPALHASSVVASLRLSSLWRGRLEVSRISLDEANLNLVRNSAGQWNIGSVLLRASQIPNAPTAERHAGAHPRFPYIEASDARIDFKDGAEKKPFSLMNAEFSMWQAGSGEWRLRLQAQPVRTDLELHLSDAGTLNVEGSLRRAADLDAMPVDLHAEWSGAQLGQVSRMVAGFDSGWRGGLDAAATIRGTAGALQLRSRVRIGDLRRQEFQPATAINVDAACRSGYRHAERLLSNITCFWPIGNGHLLLTGSVQGFASPDADLQLEINQIAATFPLTALGLMRPHAQAVTATGAVNGKFRLTSDQESHALPGTRYVLSGEAVATGVTLTYPGGTLALPAVHLVAAAATRPTRKGKRLVEVPPHQNALLLQPLAIPMGEPEPLIADARLTREGFAVHLTGSAALGRLMEVGANFGLLENALNTAAPHGRVLVNTATSGDWMPPLAGASNGIGTTGTLQVKGVELRPGFLRAPVEVESADIDLTPQQVSWENVAFRYQAIPMHGSLMHGSIQFPAVCNQPAPCPAMFTLQPGILSAATIEAVLQGKPKSGFLGQLMADALGQGNAVAWPSLQGKVQCDTLQLGRLTLRQAVGSLEVETRKLTIDSLDASALGGTLHASGTMTLEDGNPLWNLDIRVTGAKTSTVAALFHEPWGVGLVSGEATLTMSGYRMPELASSASGTWRFTWQNGGLHAPPPLEHFDLWRATGALAKSTLTVTGGGLTRAGRTNAVRGDIGFDRDLNLIMETRRGRVKIAGTLASPVVR